MIVFAVDFQYLEELKDVYSFHMSSMLASPKDDFSCGLLLL